MNAAAVEALVPRFKLERTLNQDQSGRRISLLGSIDDKPAILQLERSPFPSSQAYLASVPASLARLSNLQHNDVYAWYLALAGSESALVDTASNSAGFHHDLKVNLIYPCTETHIKKYTKQPVRYVAETPEIYAKHVRPIMEEKRGEGRLNWVYNIIEGRKEAEDVLFRTPLGAEENLEGFLLLPDFNWDRTTLEALHLLCLVERRDIWSLRDLRKSHIPWLEDMRKRLVEATLATYPTIEADQLKLYVHYQPTYYHFHVHIAHAAAEPGHTQAVGKAVDFDTIIETLKSMGTSDDNKDPGMDSISINYTVGEASDLWERVYRPLKLGKDC
ncbi:hypothetical protein HOO65_010195 [Ceratocystis lukuohia]|uniref:M7GpppX diphosphatase n=2 Tax=Ceratocystis TaxID=5157 RepID=A0A2C5X900_9PEZI|nr:m7GpppX diphosphatase [Ceratocystis fimbriata CBS 114723]